MSNVVKFNRPPKQPPGGRPPARPAFWTPERLAWPLFFAVAAVIYLVRKSGLFG